MLYIEAGAEYP